MPLPPEALLIEEWAATGDRTYPEDRTPAIDRAFGWTSAFAMAGGPTPAYEVFNQILGEITAFQVYTRDHGGLAEWNAAVTYDHPAYVTGSNGLVYQSVQDSFNVNPVTDTDNSDWRLFGSVADGSVTGPKLATGLRSRVEYVQAAQVQVVSNEIRLTPSPAMTSLPEGQAFRFQMPAATNGEVTVAVNAMTAMPLRDRFGVQVGAAAPHLIDNDVIDIVHIGGSFYLTGFRPGTASRYDAGIAEGDVPLLGPNGRLLAARLPSTISASQIGALPASKITSGKMDADRLPNRVLWLPAAGGSSPSSNGADTSDQNVTGFSYTAMAFDSSSDEHLDFMFPMPSEYGGSDIAWRAYWIPASNAGTVNWAIRLASPGDNGSIGSLSSVGSVTDTAQTSGRVHITAAITQSAGKPAAGDLVLLRVTRDVSADNMAADARLIAIRAEW